MLTYIWTGYLEVTSDSDADFVDCVDFKVHIRLHFYASKWSCVLEEHEADLDDHFHYGG